VEIRELRAFAVVAEEGSLSAAARGLHLSQSALSQTIQSAGGSADFVPADLGDEASARQLARQASELGGGHVDILVNNAGVFPFGPTHEASEADRPGLPEEIAAAITYLASDAASFVQGAILPVDGGRIAV
jgi:NAD(P)-dependent dehydrogenase (short-subunit alcohol dehydrogenase family)